jgi:hypothetical protein
MLCFNKPQIFQNQSDGVNQTATVPVSNDNFIFTHFFKNFKNFNYFQIKFEKMFVRSLTLSTRHKQLFGIFFCSKYFFETHVKLYKQFHVLS